jgi:hypothetical protein
MWVNDRDFMCQVNSSLLEDDSEMKALPAFLLAAEAEDVLLLCKKYRNYALRDHPP